MIVAEKIIAYVVKYVDKLLGDFQHFFDPFPLSAIFSSWTLIKNNLCSYFVLIAILTKCSMVYISAALYVVADASNNTTRNIGK